MNSHKRKIIHLLRKGTLGKQNIKTKKKRVYGGVGEEVLQYLEYMNDEDRDLAMEYISGEQDTGGELLFPKELSNKVYNSIKQTLEKKRPDKNTPGARKRIFGRILKYHEKLRQAQEQAQEEAQEEMLGDIKEEPEEQTEEEQLGFTEEQLQEQAEISKKIEEDRLRTLRQLEELDKAREEARQARLEEEARLKEEAKQAKKQRKALEEAQRKAREDQREAERRAREEEMRLDAIEQNRIREERRAEAEAIFQRDLENKRLELQKAKESGDAEAIRQAKLIEKQKRDEIKMIRQAELQKQFIEEFFRTQQQLAEEKRIREEEDRIEREQRLEEERARLAQEELEKKKLEEDRKRLLRQQRIAEQRLRNRKKLEAEDFLEDIPNLFIEPEEDEESEEVVSDVDIEEDDEDEENVDIYKGYTTSKTGNIYADRKLDELYEDDEDELERQKDFIKRQNRIRQYQNVIDILNTNFKKKRENYDMVSRPTESSSGGYYIRNYSTASAMQKLLNQNIHYKSDSNKGRFNNNSLNYYYGGDLYDGKYDDELYDPSFLADPFKYDRNLLNKDVADVRKAIMNKESTEFLDEEGIYSTLPIYAFTPAANDVIKHLIISPKNFKIIGSASYVSSLFPSDLDLFEIVTGTTPQETIQKFVNGIRGIIKKIFDDEFMWFDHVKLGLDIRYPEDIGKLKNGKFVPNKEYIPNIDMLNKKNLITGDEYKFMIDGPGKGQEYYERIKKILDSYRKLRWKAYEIDNGFKSLPGNVTINIDTACQQKSKINIEAFAAIDRKIIDVSNYFVLTYKNQDGEFGLNVTNEEIMNITKYMAEGLKQAIYHLYYSKLDHNPVKMVKRIFSLNRITNANDPLNNKIKDILRGDLGITYFVLSYIKTIIEFLEKDYNDFPISELKVQLGAIKDYIAKLTNLPEKIRNTSFRLINDIIKNINNVITSQNVRKEIIKDLEDLALIFDFILKALIKSDKDIKSFLPPPDKYLPPKSKREFH